MILSMQGELERQTTHRGRVFDVEVLRWTADGGQEVRRDVVRHKGAVLILPLLDDGWIVMIRNRRIAVDDWLWELPAGMLEPGEDPKACAVRELEEETGYRPGRVQLLTEFYTSPGFTDELMRVFVAERLQQGRQKLEAHEQIEVHRVRRDEAIAMATDGRIRDGKTIAALLVWERTISTRCAER